MIAKRKWRKLSSGRYEQTNCGYTEVPSKTPVIPQTFSNISYKESMKFWKSVDWKNLRKEFLSQCKNQQCKYCFEDLNNSKRLNIDHIKPIKTNWDLRLDINNLQILCEDCNKYKGSKQNGNSRLIIEECMWYSKGVFFKNLSDREQYKVKLRVYYEGSTVFQEYFTGKEEYEKYKTNLFSCSIDKNNIHWS